MSEIKVLGGLDIGNGYVKGLVNQQSTLNEKAVGLDFPSGVARVIYPKDIKTEGDDNIKYVMDDLFNHLDCSFGSNVVQDTTRRLFGSRALTSGNTIEVFDVDSIRSKAQQDLSGVLVLGSLAGQALCFYYEKHKKLPIEPLQVSARVALALPISEFMYHRKEYAGGYTNGSHRVTIHNFTNPIHIDLVFEDVQVLAEGASAQYAINTQGKPLMDAMLADVRRLGETLEGITSEDILSAQNTIGIDIGEGTVNFPVFQNGKFSPDASMTFDRGYSTVLNNALDVLGPKYFFKNRKQLADFLQQTPNNITRAKHEACWHELEKQTIGFAMEVSEQFSRVMRKVGAFTEVIYVYGGGATSLKEALHPMLLREVRGFGGEEAIYPVLYLDSRYSRRLNREGLYIVAQKLFEAETA